MIQYMPRALRKEVTYIDGGKDVHLPLTNCTATLQKKKRETALLSLIWLYYCCLSYRGSTEIGSILFLIRVINACVYIHVYY